jgi:hypothetical protein
VQVIITAERAIIPQNALGRPEHTDFVDRLLATIREAHQARLRLEEASGDEASLESGGRPQQRCFQDRTRMTRRLPSSQRRPGWRNRRCALGRCLWVLAQSWQLVEAPCCYPHASGQQHRVGVLAPSTPK